METIISSLVCLRLLVFELGALYHTGQTDGQADAPDP